ncbi:acyltransferase, partial [Lelliottia amnigena]|uniref:acyltransferase family protein n=1 Tax=Lelliottia amnigena TaxID=61646 RepID=UPI00103A987C
MNFRKDIGGLRAIAVLMVVLYHFKLPFFEGGFSGVDIFFVISGFLMSTIYLKKLESGIGGVISFYRSR